MRETNTQTSAFLLRNIQLIHPEDLRNIRILSLDLQEEENKEQTKYKKLPIDDYLEAIIESVHYNQATIVVAGTGVGKSSQVPKALMQEGYTVIVTQPRRVAARSLAKRVSAELGQEIGEDVGYATAIDRKYSPNTRVIFATDGLVLAKELAEENPDRNLVLIIDEVHEFNKNIEALLQLAKIKSQRYDCKVVLMSATMNSENLSEFFDNAPIIEVPGNAFPVKIVEKRNVQLEEFAKKILRRQENTLIFQPGIGEVESLVEELNKEKTRTDSKVTVLPLHSKLTPSEQSKCLEEHPDGVIVVATNIAQTSLTIPNIQVVLDSGLEKNIIVLNGEEVLVTKEISQADSNQRKGRTGRTTEGIYFYFCGKPIDKLEKFPTPEIQRSSLEDFALAIASTGENIRKLKFFHKPNKENLDYAVKKLQEFKLLDEQEKITNLGKEIAKLPVNFRTALMILDAINYGVLDQMLSIAAIIENRGIRDSNSAVNLQEFIEIDQDSDLLTEVNLFNYACQVSFDVVNKNGDYESLQEGLTSIGVNTHSFLKVLQSRHHLVDIMKKDFPLNIPHNGTKEDVLKIIQNAFIDLVFIKASIDGVFQKDGEDTSRILSRNSLINREIQRIVGIPFSILKFEQKLPTRLISFATNAN